MLKHCDIIVLALARWDNIYSSPAFSLAKELCRDNRVFYIDHPFSIKDFVWQYGRGDTVKSRRAALLFNKDNYRKITGLPDTFTVVTPRLTIPINWLKEGRIYNSLSQINDKIMYAALRKLIRDFDIKSYIFLNSYDPFFLRDIPTDIRPMMKIYQTIDDISQENYTARHGVRLEREAIMKADITLATSKELTKLMSKYSSQVFCLPNAADFSLFYKAATNQLEKPKELHGITQKVICYTGNIGTRINYTLLKNVALNHKDKLLLMVGPQTTEGYKKSGLDNLPNVLFVGQKDISELPAYLQYSDCALIPFEYSTLTKSIYPLKINEYLTAGRPVVTTAFSEDIMEFNDVAYVATTEGEFIDMIGQAIEEDCFEKKQKRIQKAELNTWQSRVMRFWEIVEGRTAEMTKKDTPLNN